MWEKLWRKPSRSYSQTFTAFTWSRVQTASRRSPGPPGNGFRQAGVSLRLRIHPSQPRPAKPAAIIAQVEGSGIGGPTKLIDK